MIMMIFVFFSVLLSVLLQEYSVRYFLSILSFLSHNHNAIDLYFSDWSIIYWSHASLEFIATLKLSSLLSCWIFSIETSHYSFDQQCHWQQLLLTKKHCLVREILKAASVFLNFSWKSSVKIHDFLTSWWSLKCMLKKNKKNSLA